MRLHEDAPRFAALNARQRTCSSQDVLYTRGAHRTSRLRRVLKRASVWVASGRLRASEFSGARPSSPDCFAEPVSAFQRAGDRSTCALQM